MMVKKTIIALGTVLILAVGIGGAKFLANSKPEVPKREAVIKPILVETVRADFGDYPVHVKATATVEPSQQITLKSEVSGRVDWQNPNFDTGFKINAGTTLIKVDQTDYLLELRKAEAELAKAEGDLELEMGRQDLAKEEYNLLSQANRFSVDQTYLALRGPQLQQADAAKKVAEVAVKAAKRNLQRTEISAPFDAMIIDPKVRLGSVINTNEEIATLIDVSEYYLRATVSTDYLNWLDSSARQNVQIIANGRVYQGRVRQIVGQLDAQSRLVPVYISVADPLSYDVPLLLGDYVQVQMNGRKISNVYQLPRSLVRGQNTVWTVEEGKLRVRGITPIFSDREYVYLADIEQNEFLRQYAVISSPVPTAIDGMSVSTHATENKGQ